MHFRVASVMLKAGVMAGKLTRLTFEKTRLVLHAAHPVLIPGQGILHNRIAIPCTDKVAVHNLPTVMIRHTYTYFSHTVFMFQLCYVLESLPIFILYQTFRVLPISRYQAYRITFPSLFLDKAFS